MLPSAPLLVTLPLCSFLTCSDIAPVNKSLLTTSFSVMDQLPGEKICSNDSIG